MPRRRRRQYKLQPASYFAVFIRERVSVSLWPVCLCFVHNVEKVNKGQRRQVRPIATNHVPTQECIRVVQVASRHPRKPLKVLRHKRKVNSNKEEKELCLSVVFGVLASGHLRYPKIKCSKDSCNSPHTLHIVEMRYYVVGVMKSNVYSSVGQYDTSESPNCELHLESLSKEHWCSQPKASSINSCKPAKNFNSSRHCNNHCCTCEISTSVYIKTYSVHVVRPYEESLHSNCSHCINHSYITKYWFTCKEAQYMRYNSKGGQNQYVHFGVSEKPELVLVQHYVSTTCWQKERCVEITVSKEHSQTCSKYWQTSNQLNTNKANRPYKQGHTVQSHTLRTHVCYSYQKINTSLNGSYTRHVETENCQVYRCPGVTLRATKRRVCSPPYSRSLLYQGTEYLQSLSHRLNPKTDVVHTRKCHVRCSDHYRHQPVTKPAHQSRHYYKEQHQQSVSCNLDIIELSVSCLDSWTYVAEFHTNELTHCGCNNTNPSCENKVHHSNVLCVGATKPANKKVILFVIFFHLLCLFVSSYYYKKIFLVAAFFSKNSSVG